MKKTNKENEIRTHCNNAIRNAKCGHLIDNTEFMHFWGLFQILGITDEGLTALNRFGNIGCPEFFTGLFLFNTISGPINFILNSIWQLLTSELEHSFVKSRALQLFHAT